MSNNLSSAKKNKFQPIATTRRFIGPGRGKVFKERRQR
ncbi:hypothetical protein CASFOL_003169 [Castilleja foliolosa]|uniref:Uncharacterized protein n=1 Tax=Castilleja foliolosa TaxID=1961234 RepID=A0ABD3EGE0_9LAMI